MMYRNTRSRSVLVLAAVLAAAGPAQAEDLALYDTFRGVRIDGARGRFLDPGLWDAWNTRGALEVTRKLQGGKVVLASTTHGRVDSDSGRGNGRSVLPFPEAVGALITEIQATVQTRKMDLTDCAANPDNGRLLSPRIGGYWFRDGTAPADDEDQTGSVWASLDVLRRNSHDVSANPDDLLRRNRLVVAAQVFHCGDADCQTGNTLGFEPLGVIRRGQKRRIRLTWDEANDQFVFQLHRGEPVAIPYDGALNVQAPPRFSKRIEHRGQPENCDLGADPSAARTVVNGEVRVFDVRVNEAAIP